MECIIFHLLLYVLFSLVMRYKNKLEILGIVTRKKMIIENLNERKERTSSGSEGNRDIKSINSLLSI